MSYLICFAAMLIFPSLLLRLKSRRKQEAELRENKRAANRFSEAYSTTPDGASYLKPECADALMRRVIGKYARGQNREPRVTYPEARWTRQ